jgi:hypothetical protein
MFYVLATLQNPSREVFVHWTYPYTPCFYAIDNPPKSVSREEAEWLLSKCQECHGWMYDHNLRIVPA